MYPIYQYWTDIFITRVTSYNASLLLTKVGYTILSVAILLLAKIIHTFPNSLFIVCPSTVVFQCVTHTDTETGNL